MALSIIELDGGKTLEVTASGKLHKDDYEKFGPVFEQNAARHAKLRVLFVMRDFHGWDAGGLWSDIKFDAKHFNDVEKVAMVGDAQWEKGMATFCKPFTSADVKFFDLAKLEEARTWVRG